MSLLTKKVLGVTVAIAVVAVAIWLYVADWATSFPKTVSSTAAVVGGGTDLTIETVGAAGVKPSPSHPDWVSYLVRSEGRWLRSTVYRVPAHSIVHVTLYEFDSPTGMRNPFMAQVQGTIGGTMTLNGKTVSEVKPEEAAHTFAVPELGVFVPLPGVPETAKNPCEEGPCEPSMSDHNTITFSFRTGKPGRYHWQCFVPCGAGYIDGNGGPMQTLGYMDGYLDVV